MEIIEIFGGRPLNGNVTVQGSKNAVLPMIAASILTDEKVVLKNCPHIDDVYTMLNLIEELGCRVNFENHVIEIDAGSIVCSEITGDSKKSTFFDNVSWKFAWSLQKGKTAFPRRMYNWSKTYKSAY